MKRIMIVIGVIVFVAVGVLVYRTTRHDFVDGRVRPTTVALCPGESETLVTEVRWDDGTWHDWPAVDWRSNDPDIAEVDDGGTVNAVAATAGQTEVTGRVSLYQFKASVSVIWPVCSSGACGPVTNRCGTVVCGSPDRGNYFLEIADPDAACDQEREQGDWIRAWRCHACATGAPLPPPDDLLCFSADGDDPKPEQTCRCS